MPKRIQRKRTKGWKMPEGAVYVGRPTKWGNVTRIGDKHWFSVPGQFHTELRPCTAEEALYLFRRHATILQDEAAMNALRGKDLACWCPLNQPCHADVLLEIANADPERVLTEAGQGDGWGGNPLGSSSETGMSRPERVERE